ncbi:Lrp/AsnC family transcriptional regulator [Peptoniphilus sp. MSJ-1]|uniref:Lrp/AsnC family transcriptional regulator n=1 Tax=Peptoniphilus ovalis TaxID=2841503 RepID=A0ABS6FGP4_9FIRM|nr:Lrp/AsnC family transcriptional regulator [Peptoniphilus ovalis]MBU5668385.1 Lrp/AsnC family transcriptional regulator [Peptoniphilus ovalis]
MRKNNNLDEIDIEILQLLSENGRMSHEDISKKLNLTRPAIHRRIYKMEDSGYIKGYKVLIDWQKIGYNLDTYVLCKVNTNDFERLISEIMEIKDPNFKIFECYRVTGDHCVMLRIKTINTADLTRFYDMILRIEGIVDTKTLLILYSEKGNEKIFEKSDEDNNK